MIENYHNLMVLEDVVKDQVPGELLKNTFGMFAGKNRFYFV